MELAPSVLSESKHQPWYIIPWRPGDIASCELTAAASRDFAMFLQSVLLATFAFSSSALAAFGITTSGNNIVVDAGSDNGLKVTVNSGSCDITSILYRGEEFQYQSQYSHLSSGLGTATVSSQIVNSKTNLYTFS